MALSDALNYEFQRLELEALALPTMGKTVRIYARSGEVRVPGYVALMSLAGVKKDAPWHERQNALTRLLSFAR